MEQAENEKKYVYLLGNPVAHSISPQMHNAAFQAKNLNYEYQTKLVLDKELPETVESLRAPNVAGFNVTIPHKENIMKYLDVITTDAKKIGAVNTVKCEDGKLYGLNTDTIGFLGALSTVELTAKKAVLLGAGGAARSAAIGLCKAGVSSLIIYDISIDKAMHLETHLKKYFNIPIKFVKDIEALNSSILEADILINSTPIGMHPNIDESPVDEKVLHKGLYVYDLVYNPIETKLIKSAKAKGANGTTGLGMLVGQGAVAFAIITGLDAPFDVMWKAAEKALGLGQK